MAKRKTNLSEEKQNIIAALLNEYEIHSAEDIQDALKDLLGGTVQSMLEAEMDNHLGYGPYEHSGNINARNNENQKLLEVSTEMVNRRTKRGTTQST